MQLNREKKKGITEDDLKRLVYKRNPQAHYVVKDGIVTIIKENNHPIQRKDRKQRQQHQKKMTSRILCYFFHIRSMFLRSHSVSVSLR